MKNPVAYVAVSNSERRARIVDGLQRHGWSVVEYATGFHVLAALAEVLDGDTREVPRKIVIDAYARGCTGKSIASGLAALGLQIDVELVDDLHVQRPPAGGLASACTCA
jgi:hypothetical protein